MGKRKRKTEQGYYCWCCERMRPGKRFSPRGRRRHVCKDCKRLGEAELTFRQAQRDIDRTRGLSGAILRKRRSVFERFLNHPHPRIREYAQAVKQQDEALRESWRLERLERQREEIEWEMLAESYRELDETDDEDAVVAADHASSSKAPAGTDESRLEEIPF
jgi:hypothetical protein